MGLNIAATRTVSLKEFADGWDGAFIKVRAASTTEQKAQQERLKPLLAELQEDQDSGNIEKARAAAMKVDEEADRLSREFAEQLIIGGKVISTKEDGTTELVEFGKDDIPAVLDALSFFWINHIVEIASGADRLKAGS